MTPSAITNIGYKFYIIFAILNAMWVPVIYFFVPVSARQRVPPADRQETKGKSLEEIDLLFASHSVSNMQEAKDEYSHHEVSKVGGGAIHDVENKSV